MQKLTHVPLAIAILLVLNLSDDVIQSFELCMKICAVSNQFRDSLRPVTRPRASVLKDKDEFSVCYRQMQYSCTCASQHYFVAFAIDSSCSHVVQHGKMTSSRKSI